MHIWNETEMKRIKKNKCGIASASARQSQMLKLKVMSCTCKCVTYKLWLASTCTDFSEMWIPNWNCMQISLVVVAVAATCPTAIITKNAHLLQYIDLITGIDRNKIKNKQYETKKLSSFWNYWNKSIARNFDSLILRISQVEWICFRLRTQLHTRMGRRYRTSIIKSDDWRIQAKFFFQCIYIH